MEAWLGGFPASWLAVRLAGWLAEDKTESKYPTRSTLMGGAADSANN